MDAYQAIFGDILVEKAAHRIVYAINLEHEALKADTEMESNSLAGQISLEAHWRRVAQTRYGKICNILGKEPGTGTYAAVDDAVKALSTKSGEDYSWLLKVFNHDPKKYAEEHDELNETQLDLLRTDITYLDEVFEHLDLNLKLQREYS